MSKLPPIHVLLAIPNCELKSAFRGEIEANYNAEIREATGQRQAVEIMNAVDVLQFLVADLHMGANPWDVCGLSVLKHARERFGRHCYNVVISASYTSRLEFADRAGENESFDFFLSTRYTEHNPIERLHQAIECSQERAFADQAQYTGIEAVPATSPKVIEP